MAKMSKPIPSASSFYWPTLATFATILLFLFLRATVPVPIYDDWEIVPLLQKGEGSTLRFSDFWAPHNEHRPVVPRLIQYTLAQATHWDIRRELALNFVLGAGLAITVIVQIGNIYVGMSWLGLAMTALLLSPAQWQNWMLGWQLQLWLCMFCGILSLIIINRNPHNLIAIVPALLLALVATFSFAAGLIWLFLVCFQLVLRYKRYWVSVLVGSIYLGILFLYLHNLGIRTTDSPSTGPINFLLYVLVWIGQPLTPWHPVAAGIAGAVGLLTAVGLFLSVRCRTILKANSHLLCSLAAFSILSACLAAWSRGGYGIDQAMSSRYITLANPFWVAIFAAVGICVAKRGSKHRAMLLGLALSLIVGTGYLYGLYQWDERYDAYSAAADALVSGGDNPALIFLYPDPEILAERRAFLKAHQLSVFRQPSL